MNPRFKAVSWAIALSLTAGFSMAQQTDGTATKVPGAATPAPAAPKAPSKATAQSEAGEPRATLSPAPGAPGAAAPGSAQPTAATPAGQTSKAAPRAAASGVPAAGARSGKADRLDLGTATVTGDREQPKVMYIVPWKRSDIGDLNGKPMNSLLDEALTPVDRDEFKREVAYYDAVHADAPQSGAGNSAGKQGEK